MTIIKKPPKSIIVQTRKGSDIKNIQDYVPLTFGKLLELKDLKSEFPFVTIRGKVNSLYNCHGLTFASKRTCISELADLEMVLKEDDYSEIDFNETLPGDIVLYFSENGDIEHSGILVDTNEGGVRALKILSKWGSTYEVIHAIGNCPYNSLSVKYYRNE